MLILSLRAIAVEAKGVPSETTVSDLKNSQGGGGGGGWGHNILPISNKLIYYLVLESGRIYQ